MQEQEKAREKAFEEKIWEYKNYIAQIEKEKADLQKSRVPDELLNAEQKAKKQAEQLEKQYQLVKYLNLNEKKAEKKKRTNKHSSDTIIKCIPNMKILESANHLLVSIKMLH